jgi:hypothetical protein
MQPKKKALSSQTSEWTEERIGLLDKTELQQLRANAGALDNPEIVALCDEALRALPRGGGRSAGAPAKSAKARRLISRRKAFEARGVHLVDPRTSWSGVRKSDGVVVMSLWADSIKSRDGSCSYLLWAPNTDGTQPWYDTPAGRERLEHCRLALEAKLVEGLLVYGDLLDGHIAEDKARSVHGVDPEALLHFTIEKRGEEYWAVWGRKT